MARKYIHKKSRSIAFWFSLVVILVFLIILLFILPKADMNIYVKEEPIKINFNLKLDLKNKEINFINDEIPTRLIKIEVPAPREMTDQGIIYSSLAQLSKQKFPSERISFDICEVINRNYNSANPKAEVLAYAFKNDDLNKIIDKKMQAIINSDQIFINKQNNVNYNIKEFKPVDNRIFIEVNAENGVIPSIDRDKILEDFYKKSNEQLLAYISSNYPIISSEIILWPFNNEFIKKLLTTQRIYINIIPQP